LQQMAVDPANPEAQSARMALIEINQHPDKKEQVLLKFFTPQEPQMSPEEEQFVQGPGGPEIPGDSRSVSTVLSRLEQSGATEGGVQTVGRL